MEDQSNFTSHSKALLNWFAAALGIGSAADMVPIIVGVLSTGWLLVQMWGYFMVDRPNKLLDRENKELDREIKRARLAAIRSGHLDACDVEDLL